MSESETLNAEQIIEQFQPLIQKLARTHAKTIAGIEDLCQEGALAICESLPKYTPERGALKNFVYTCVRNRILGIAIENSMTVKVPSGSYQSIKDRQKDFFRASADVGFYEKNGANYTATSGKCDTPHETMVEWLDIIEQFDDQHGTAKLYFVDRLKYNEISEITGRSAPAISRHVNEVRSKIKEAIQ